MPCFYLQQPYADAMLGLSTNTFDKKTMEGRVAAATGSRESRVAAATATKDSVIVFQTWKVIFWWRVTRVCVFECASLALAGHDGFTPYVPWAKSVVETLKVYYTTTPQHKHLSLSEISDADVWAWDAHMKQNPNEKFFSWEGVVTRVRFPVSAFDCLQANNTHFNHTCTLPPLHLTHLNTSLHTCTPSHLHTMQKNRMPRVPLQALDDSSDDEPPKRKRTPTRRAPGLGALDSSDEDLSTPKKPKKNTPKAQAHGGQSQPHSNRMEELKSLFDPDHSTSTYKAVKPITVLQPKVCVCMCVYM
jgi:hypothetical protein